MEGKQFRDLELDIQMHIEKCRTCSHGARAFWFRKPARKPQRMELAAAPSSPVLPQRCPSPARPSTATVESDPAASVLQATRDAPERDEPNKKNKGKVAATTWTTNEPWGAQLD